MKTLLSAVSILCLAGVVAGVAVAIGMDIHYQRHGDRDDLVFSLITLIATLALMAIGLLSSYACDLLDIIALRRQPKSPGPEELDFE